MVDGVMMTHMKQRTQEPGAMLVKQSIKYFPREIDRDVCVCVCDMYTGMVRKNVYTQKMSW